jgi:Flp pilus assembly pilin Flp
VPDKRHAGRVARGGRFKFSGLAADVCTGHDTATAGQPSSSEEGEGANRMNLFVVRTWLTARLTKSERGASLVEYILLVALIAIAVIASVVFLRDQLSTKFNDAGSTVSRLPNP